MYPAALVETAGVMRRARRILAMCHVSPDGDAIGSLLGLGWLMRELPLELPGTDKGRASALSPSDPDAGRAIVLACADAVPPQLRFLPGVGEITAKPPAGVYDVVVTLDASDPLRLGGIFRAEITGSTPIVNLDHHVTNLRFGTHNYVATSAAATSEVVVDLADALGIPIRKPAATCLLTGIVTDTLSFRTPSVTPRVLQMAARLMEAGADITEITERAMNSRPARAMRLWGLALSQLRCQGGVIWTSVSREMKAEAGAPEDGDSGLSSFLINAPEADVAAVFTEQPNGQVEVGLRSRPGFDVSQVALGLGGGGHPQAAGCIVAGPLEAAEARVVALLYALTGTETVAGTLTSE